MLSTRTLITSANCLLTHLQRLKREVSRERTPQRDTRLKSKTPQPPPVKEKSPSIRAGSEEGEIEED